MDPLPLHIRNMPLSRYERIWRQQKQAQQALISGEGEDCIFLCEHHPVITLGKSANKENVIASREELEKRGVSVLTVERGGDVTFHGPGQLVAYPIVDLRKRKTDVDWYIRGLEQATITTLNHYGIEGQQIKGQTGVWVCESKKSSEPSKIASIGVRLSRWCTLHGVSINRADVSDGFSLIHGCGFPQLSVTSVEEELEHQVDAGEFLKTFVHCFCSFFDYTPLWDD